MKKSFFILIAFFTILSACTKVEKTRTSGKDTIDNSLYNNPGSGYFAYGFSFSQASLIPTSNSPGPDITIYVNRDNSRLTLQTSNLNPSFYKVGDFTDEDEARSAFNNLKTFTADQWEEMADPVNPNQLWIFRTGRDTYAKIRIINTVNEIRETVPYGECTFQWVYQSDGSLTFPE